MRRLRCNEVPFVHDLSSKQQAASSKRQAASGKRQAASGKRQAASGKPHPGRVWNRISDEIRERLARLAPDETQMSPRELAVLFTDTEKHFVSEASVYVILKTHDLITSPAFVVIKAGDEFRDKTKRPNQMWQTDFT